MIMIKNLTPKVQSIEIEEFASGRGFTLYVEGNGVADVEGAYIPNIERYEGIFKIGGQIAQSRVIDSIESISEEIIEDKENKENEEDVPPVEDESLENDIVEDKFICDICKAEFASARGLASHKNRTHPEESK